MHLENSKITLVLANVPLIGVAWYRNTSCGAIIPSLDTINSRHNLPGAKKEFPRLKAVPSQVLQTNIRRLHDAIDFFINRGFGFPRYKKYGQMKSILFPQFKTNPLTGWQVKLPKLGLVQINLHRPIPDGFVIKQIRIVKKAKGWYAVTSIQSDWEIPDPVPHGHCIGLDVGLLSYCATSDGFVEPGRTGRTSSGGFLQRQPLKFFKTLYRKHESATTQIV